MREMGFCQGIENYSRHLTGREPGATPYTLLDFFPDDFMLIVDESHASIPQIGGMYEGDHSRKSTLVEFGFRLPSALDNRPLRFSEFMARTGQILYVSATPARFEVENSVVGNEGYIPHLRARIGDGETVPALTPRISGTADPVETFDVVTPGKVLIAEQIIRPTGLLDPVITMKPLKGQIDETIEQCRAKARVGDVLRRDRAHSSPHVRATRSHSRARGCDHNPNFARRRIRRDEGQRHASLPSGMTAVISTSTSQAGRASATTTRPVKTGNTPGMRSPSTR